MVTSLLICSQEAGGGRGTMRINAISMHLRYGATEQSSNRSCQRRLLHMNFSPDLPQVTGMCSLVVIHITMRVG